MIDDLIARLEKATGPDRVMDADIHVAASGGRCSVILEHYPPHYTSSLDAALTLVPALSLWSLCYMEDGPFAQVIRPMPGGGYINGLTDAKGSTAAIALCIASLRARQKSLPLDQSGTKA